MDDPKKDPRRMMKGLRIHRDVDWDYSFWRPLQWHRFDMTDQYGFIYSPGDDPRTGFYVAPRDLSDVLDGPVQEEDLPALHEGILEGLRQLPDCKILEDKEIAKGFAIGFEVLLTFTLDGETCKRRMRLLYNDRQQYTLYGQGTPEYEYEVFHDTYEFIYSTFTFADLLAMSGMPVTPASATRWEGGTEGVQVKPSAPRDHSAWVAEKMREIDDKVKARKAETAEETAAPEEPASSD
ncbi:MAG: hypothetical protein JXA09_06300 [Anaerolineae bacterium]|nr:hypothetical protein [Anaerolineae bacterium]